MHKVSAGSFLAFPEAGSLQQGDVADKLLGNAHYIHLNEAARPHLHVRKKP